MASMRKGWFSATALRRASFVALYTAKTSFPSTRIDISPYPGPRAALERKLEKKEKQIRQMKRRDSHGSLCRKDLLTNTVPSILLIGRCGDSITVITAEEYERTFKGGGEIKSSMCVSLTGRPLSEVTDHHTVCILPLHCVRRPGRYSKNNRSKSLLRFTLLFKGLRPLNRVTSNGC